MYETVTEAAAQIRAAYKARGWTSKQISVRAESFSMGSAIRVTLKDGAIPLHLVKQIADGKKRISHCEITGEILSGGNRYVSVEVTDEARALKAHRYVEAVERAAALLNDPPDGTLQPIVAGYYLGRGYHGYNLTLWGDSFIVQRQSAEEIAYHLAIYLEEYSQAEAV